MATAVSAHSDILQRAREDLAAAHRLAVRDGLNEGTWNHFTLAHPTEPGRMLCSPSYTHWSQVTASSLLDVGPEFERSDDEMEWTAYRIHYPVHEAREDAACALHVHSPNLVALSMLEQESFPLWDQHALNVGTRVVWNQDFDGLVEDEEQGRRMAAALGDSATSLILRNHGALVCGATVADAYTDLYMLERSTQAAMLAMATGRPLRELGQREIDVFTPMGDSGPSEFRHRHFEAMKRVLDAEEPDYRD